MSIEKDNYIDEIEEDDEEENNFEIKRWMIKELHLTGNDLIVFAAIYHFSDNGKNIFTLGRKQLSQFLEIPLRTVDRVLQRLIKNHLITKMPTTKNNAVFYNYRIVFENFDFDYYRIILMETRVREHKNKGVE